MKCQTCGRPPSERHPDYDDGPMATCTDPIHDLADQAPALLEALENMLVWHDLVQGLTKESLGFPIPSPLGIDKARAAILAAKGETK